MGKEGGHYVDALAHSHMIEGQQVPEKEKKTLHTMHGETKVVKRSV